MSNDIKDFDLLHIKLIGFKLALKSLIVTSGIKTWGCKFDW